nr:hypothetical protein CFP56_54146 [Quercus suber]
MENAYIFKKWINLVSSEEDIETVKLAMFHNTHQQLICVSQHPPTNNRLQPTNPNQSTTTTDLGLHNNIQYPPPTDM